jgi:hypothetical protein
MPEESGFPTFHFTTVLPGMFEVFTTLGLTWVRLGEGVTVWQGGEWPGANRTYINVSSLMLLQLRFYLERRLFGDRR